MSRQYRLFTVGDNGRVSTPAQEFVSLNDDAAIIEARRMLNEPAHELWEDGRLVARVSGDAESERPELPTRRP